MSKKNIRILLILLAIIIVSISLDQITKTYFASNLKEGESISILGEFLRFEFKKNYGASFGMLSGRSTLFFIITMLGLPMFAFLLYKNKDEHLVGTIGLSLMIGGTIGNVIDRIMYASNGKFFSGYVRDFIAVKGFAIFNVADSCLCVGVALYIFALLFVNKDRIFNIIKKDASIESNDQTENFSNK